MQIKAITDDVPALNLFHNRDISVRYSRLYLRADGNILFDDEVIELVRQAEGEALARAEHDRHCDTNGRAGENERL